MTELYLHLKIYVDSFPVRLKYAKLGEEPHLSF